MKLKKISSVCLLFCLLLPLFCVEILLILYILDVLNNSESVSIPNFYLLVGAAVGILLVLAFFLPLTCYILKKGFFEPLETLDKAVGKAVLGEDFSVVSDCFPEEYKSFSNLLSALLKTKGEAYEKLLSDYAELVDVSRNVPCGLIICTLDAEYEILYQSEGFLSLLGCTPKEAERFYANSLYRTVLEQDREAFVKKLKSQLCRGEYFAVEYRTKRADGSDIWVLNKGRFVKEGNKKPLLYCVAVDITALKGKQPQMLSSGELNSLVLSQTEDVVFEYTLEADSVLFSSNWLGKYGQRLEYFNLLEELFKSERIYFEDYPSIREFLLTIINGTLYARCEFRMQKQNGEYIWCCIRASAVYDEHEKLYKVVGVLADIDKEKKQSQVLLTLAQKDPLTGLYNKGATKSLINEYLQKEGMGRQHTFFIIDIDYFKKINDNFGHFFGDTLLTEIAQEFSGIFRTTDILGRIGGDEFVVLMKDMSSRDLVISKARHLIESCSGSAFAHKHEMIKISCSIGISVYPTDGKDFMTLYQNADSALYMAKNQGRAKYCFYSGE